MVDQAELNRQRQAPRTLSGKISCSKIGECVCHLCHRVTALYFSLILFRFFASFPVTPR
jgi:hypothetical protein